MTESEWLNCGKATDMYRAARKVTSPRKFRLFVIECFRPLLSRITDVACRRAMAVAERYAEGEADLVALTIAREAIRYRNRLTPAYLARSVADETLHFGVCTLSCHLLVDAALNRDEARKCVERSQADLYREIMPNPFRPVISPLWHLPDGGEVQRLASSVYESKRFDDLPILADALEEFGCADVSLLDHLRGPGPHVRGCWALDLVLGKE